MSPYRASGQHQLQRQSASPSSASSAGAAAPAPATLAPHTNGRAIHLNRQRQRQRHQRVVFGSRIAKTHPAILANIPLENHQPEVGDAAADNRLSARAPVRSAPGRRLYDCADNRTTLNPIVGGGSCFVRRGMFPNDGSARPLQHRPIAPRARAHPHADYSAALTYRGKLMKTTTDNIIRVSIRGASCRAAPADLSSFVYLSTGSECVPLERKTVILALSNEGTRFTCNQLAVCCLLSAVRAVHSFVFYSFARAISKSHLELDLNISMHTYTHSSVDHSFSLPLLVLADRQPDSERCTGPL